jgi:hypothetical protein
VLGAFAFVLLDELASQWSVGRHMMFGALLIVVVFALPRGMAGGLVAMVQAVKRQLGKRADQAGAGDNAEERRATLLAQRRRDGQDAPR